MSDDDWGSSRPALTSTGWTAPLPTSSPEPPTRYDLVERIAQGAEGDVWRAYDRHLLREVALKRLRRQDADAVFLLCARLAHPSIVPIHDAGVLADGRVFYTMDLVHHETLEARIRSGAGVAALPHVLAMGQALAFAHDQGLVHQDIKPANVVVGRFDETQVVDWGLVAESGASRAGFVGTPWYASPEQLLGQPVDPRDDVWALGCVLVELLTGSPAFAADSIEAIQALHAGPRPAVAVDGELQSVVDRALAPADQRYRDAGAFTTDLQAWMRGDRVRAHVYGPTDHLRRLWRRERFAVGIAAGAVVLGIGGLLVALALMDGARREAVAARDAAEVAAGRSLWLLAAQQARGTPGPDTFQMALDALQAWDSPQTRGLWMGLAAQSLQPEPVRTARRHTDCDESGFIEGVEGCRRDGKVWWGDHVYETGPYARRKGVHWVRPGSDGCEALDASGSWSTVGCHGVGRRGEAWVSAEVDGLRLSIDEALVRPCDGLILDGSLAADARGWSVLCKDSRVVMGAWDTNPVAIEPPAGATVFSHARVGDGVVIGREDGSVQRLTEGGDPLWRADLGMGLVGRVFVSEEGRWVAVGTPEGEAMLDLQTGSLLRRLPGLDAVDMARDGATLLRLTAREVERWEAPEQLAVWQLGQGIDAIAAHEGRLGVASARRLMVLEPGRQQRMLADGEGNVFKAVAWHQGDLYAVGSLPVRARRVLGGVGPVTEFHEQVSGKGLVAVVDGVLVQSYGRSFSFLPQERFVALKGWTLDLESDARGAWALIDDGSVWHVRGPDDMVQVASHVGASQIAGFEDRYVVTVGLVHTLHSRSGPVCSWERASSEIAWSPDGRWLVDGRADGSVGLMDPKDCGLLAEARLHEGQVSDVAFDAEGFWTSSWDGQVRRWLPDEVTRRGVRPQPVTLNGLP